MTARYEAGSVDVRWDAAAIPAGFSARLEVTDSTGALLSPAPDIAYDPAGGQATVSGASVQPPASIALSLTVVSPPAALPAFALVDLGFVAAPDLTQGAEGLRIAWHPVAGADSYEVQIADAADQPLDPQPAVGETVPPDPTTAAVALEALDDLTTYGVRVRAVAGRSFGGWSGWSQIRIDKSRPVSAQLRALLDRLRTEAASGDPLTLGPDVIGAGHISHHIDTTLGGPLVLQGPEIGSDATHVRVAGQATLAGAAAARAELAFTETDGAVQMVLTCPLGNRSLAELQTAELFPADMFDASGWAASVARIDNAQLDVDTARGSTRVTSPDALTLSLAAIGMDSVSVPLGPARPQFDVAPPYLGRPKRYFPRFAATLDLGAATPLEVLLSCPQGTEPWRLTLAEPWRVGDIAGLAVVLGGEAPVLPDGVGGVAELTVTRMALSHVPGSGATRMALAATLTPPGGAGAAAWGLGASGLSMDLASLSIEAVATAGGLTGLRGVIGGRLVMGTLAPLEVRALLPAADGRYALTARTLQPMQSADGAELFGGDGQAVATSLGRLGTVTDFALRELYLSVDPSGATLHRAALALSVGRWTIPAIAGLTITDLGLDLDALTPADPARRQIEGGLRGTVAIGRTSFGVAGRYRADGSWSFDMSGAVGMPGGLEDLSALISPAQVAGMAPADEAGQLPDTTAFAELRALSVAYQAPAGGQGAGFVSRLALSVALPRPIPLVGDRFVLDSVDLDLTALRDDPGASLEVTGHIRAELTLAGTRFALAAERGEGQANWAFEGRLRDALALSLGTVLTDLGIGDVQLPQADGAPAQLIIVEAGIRLVPATGAMALDLASEMNWSVGFGPAAIALTALAVELDVPGSDATDTAATAKLAAAFRFGDLATGGAEIRLGEAGTETVLRLSANPPAQGETAPTAADLVAEAGAPALTPLVPKNWPLGLEDIGLVVNLDRDLMVLRGTLAGHAAAYGLVLRGKKPDGTPAPTQVLVAATLTDGFSFSALHQGLEPLERVIDVTSGSFVVYSRAKSGSAALKAAFDGLEPRDLPKGTHWPLGPDSDPETGLLLSAEFSIPAGSLFGRLVQIGDGSTTAPAPAALTARIDAATPGNSSVEIALPQMTLLGIVTLTLTARFIPAQERQITLSGPVVLTGIGGGTFGFHGELILTDAKASGTLDLLDSSTDKQVSGPFQLPGIVLTALQLEVTRVFGAAASTSLAVLGAVLLGPAPPTGATDRRLAMTARLDLAGSELKLFSVALPRDFDVGDFLAQFVSGAGADWSSHGFIDLRFRAGSVIYYLDDAAAAQEMGARGGLPAAVLPLREGLHVTALVTLTLVEDIDLTLHVSTVAEGGSRFGAIKADVQLDNAIKLLFLEFAGDTLTQAGDAYDKGPSIGIRTGAQAAFRLSTGINFFGKGMVKTEVEIRGGTAPAEKSVLTGRISGGPALGPLGAFSVGFTCTRYSDHTALALTDWPIPDVDGVIDLMREIKSAVELLDKSGGGCQSLANFLTDSALATRFSAGKPDASVQGDALVLSFTVSCDMYIGSVSGQPLLSRDLPPVSLTIPGDTRFDDLPGLILDNLRTQGATFAKNLLEDEETLAMILGMAFAKKAASYGLALVCRSAVRAILAAAAEEAGAAIGTALEAGTAVVASTIFGLIKKALGGGDDDDDDTPSAGGPSSGTPPGGVALLPHVPLMRSLERVSGGLRGNWNPASLSASYDMEISGPGLPAQVLSAGVALSALYPVADLDTLRPGTFQARARGRRDSYLGDWSAAVSLTIVQTAPPQVTLSCDGSALVATVALTAGATGEVVFSMPDGTALGTPQAVTADSPEARVALPAGATGRFTAQATAHRDGEISSAPGPAADCRVWAAPTDLEARWGAGGLDVQWLAEAGATGVLRITDASGAALAPAPQVVTPQGAETRRFVTGPALIDGTALSLAVRVEMPGSLSPWSDPFEITLEDLAPPADLACLFDGSTLTVSWSLPDGVGSGLELTGAGGAALDPAPVIDRSVPGRAVVTGPALAAGQAISARVRAETQTAFSAWTAVQTVTLAVLEVPVALSAQFRAEGGISVRYQLETLGPCEVQILDAAGMPLPDLTVTSQQATGPAQSAGPGNSPGVVQRSTIDLVYDDPRLTADQSFTVRMRRADPQVVGAWAGPVAVGPVPIRHDLAVPRDLVVRVVPAGLLLDLTADPAATAVRVTVDAPDGSSTTQDLALPGPVTVPSTVMEGGYDIVVQALADGHESAISDPLALEIAPDPAWGLTLLNDGTDEIAFTARLERDDGMVETVGDRLAPGGSAPLRFSGRLVLEAPDPAVQPAAGDLLRRVQEIGLVARTTGSGLVLRWSEIAAVLDGSVALDDFLLVRTRLGLQRQDGAQSWWVEDPAERAPLLAVRALDLGLDAAAVRRLMAGLLDDTGLGAVLLGTLLDTGAALSALVAAADPTPLQLRDIWDGASRSAGQMIEPCLAARTLAGLPLWSAHAADDPDTALAEVVALGADDWSLADRLTLFGCSGVWQADPSRDPAELAHALASLSEGLAIPSDQAAVAVARAVRAAHILTGVERGLEVARILAKVLPPPVVAARVAPFWAEELARGPWPDYALGAFSIRFAALDWRDTPPDPAALVRAFSRLELPPQTVAPLVRRLVPEAAATDLARPLTAELRLRAMPLLIAPPAGGTTLVAWVIASSDNLAAGSPAAAEAALMAAAPDGLPYPLVFAAGLLCAGVPAETVTRRLEALTTVFRSTTAAGIATSDAELLKGLYA
ncbi:hypothetical protein M4578_12620 [Salipiger sp. P9]|uniref:hypothetical protein n=1 Tax=Salipiger pentaromativorans TaxID=2943193 RepID=UPI0021581FDA|nr:hypothetical protein [Salipiger pentaromativorans]MCR8548675.1 hypothetical protein [Salipiger pentaromativorans]